jgi:ABC-2 type transport system permease protein
MKIDKHVVWVIAKRDFRGYFSGPTGYVFITLFILLSAAAAFWQQRFFANNLATLDQLNDLFPLILLFFVPALTMSVWAEERRKGTDELLLTIPASDIEVTLGKYFGVVGIYTIAILLSLSHVVVLLWLGRPDLGLMISNYLGYWLAGSALIGVGMLASLLVTNATIGFLLGAIFCSVLVLLSSPLVAVSETVQGLLKPIGLENHFTDFTRGVVSLSGLVYFLSVAGVSLYLNVLLLSRRHWPQQADGQRFAFHQGVRVIAVLVAVIAGNVILNRPALRLDVTAEQIHGLSRETKDLIRQLPADHPVLINAYVSPDVPRALVETRENLLSALREISAVGGSRVQVQIYDVQPFSSEARDAREKYGISPRELMAQESARSSSFQVYLGVAFACGARQEVIPFLEKGLPVEYELTRSIRVVANAQRKRIGVLNTDVNLFGGFDYQNMSQTPPWSVVQEIHKQYDVVRVSADAPITDSLDALLAVMPSTLTQPQLNNLKSYVLAGHPTLLADDPLPLINVGLSPVLPSGGQMNPMQQNREPEKQKGDVVSFFKDLGINWNPLQVAWDTYNPHREIIQTPPEVIFVVQSSNGPEAFNQQNEITSGLQEMVMMYPGYMYKAVDSKFDFQPLLRTSHVSGNLRWDQLIQRGFFGPVINRNPQRVPSEESYIMAAQLTGDAPTGIDAARSDRKFDCVVVADVDFISEQFFQIRAQGIENLNFDNVTFFLNAIDLLAGDHSFVELRKKRVIYRTLESVEHQTREYVEKRLMGEKLAEAEAQKALAEAQGRLDQKVAEVRNRTDLDAQAKQIMAQNLQEVESRRLQVAKANIEDRKQAAIQASKENMESSVRTIQSRIRTLAVLIPPLPVFAAGVLIFIRRRKREREGAIAARRLRS